MTAVRGARMAMTHDDGTDGATQHKAESGVKSQEWERDKFLRFFFSLGNMGVTMNF